MSEIESKEKLSSLLDGEMDIVEGLRTMRSIQLNPEVREQWRRYCLVKESMKSRTVLIPDRGFADRVSAAVADEPTVLAPRFQRKQVKERVITTALAASLALVAVMVAKSLQEYSPIRGAEMLALSSLVGPSDKSGMDPEFSEYLVSHYETAYLSGAQGMLPSARLVSASTGQ